MHDGSDTRSGRRHPVSPYRFITGFGLISLLMDVVYEGALAVQGPLLASVGASAVVVGVVSGLGEATALGGRAFTGPWADRTRRYWAFAIAGYGITAIAVPLMGIAGSVVAVSSLVIVERFGKSLRTPSRDSMLASAASAVGVGRGFAIHEAIDQIGAVLGPLIVAWVLAVTANDYAPALGVLAVPGVLAIGVLVMLRRRVPHPEVYEPADAKPRLAEGSLRRSKPFWWYMLFTFVTCSAIATFGVMSFHMVSVGIVGDAMVPVLYALAMGVDAAAAMMAGLAYDRFHLRSLYVLPLVAVVIPFVAYRRSLVPVIAGVVLWGIATGVQESTMRAVIADIAPRGSRASAYGYFAIALGLGALAGGSIAGWLSAVSIPALIGFTTAAQAVALGVLVRLDGLVVTPPAR